VPHIRARHMRTATPRPSIRLKAWLVGCGRATTAATSRAFAPTRPCAARPTGNGPSRPTERAGRFPGCLARPDTAAPCSGRKAAQRGVTVDEIARRLSAGVRSVQRWISEIGLFVRSAPSPSTLSDFERPHLAKPTSVVSGHDYNIVVDAESKTPSGGAVRSAASTAPESGATSSVRTDQPSDVPAKGRGVRGETGAGGPMANTQRRVREIVATRYPRPP